MFLLLSISKISCLWAPQGIWDMTTDFLFVWVFFVFCLYKILKQYPYAPNDDLPFWWSHMANNVRNNILSRHQFQDFFSTGFYSVNLLNASFAENCFSKRHFRNWETRCRHRNCRYSNFNISPPLSIPVLFIMGNVSDYLNTSSFPE